MYILDPKSRMHHHHLNDLPSLPRMFKDHSQASNRDTTLNFRVLEVARVHPLYPYVHSTYSSTTSILNMTYARRTKLVHPTLGCYINAKTNTILVSYQHLN